MIIIQQTFKLRLFGKTIVELLPYICTKIAIGFPINYRPTLQQIKNLIKSSLKTIASAPGNPLKKLILTKFSERAYKA